MGALPAVTLVLGGARSGKSLYAERLVMQAAGAGTYVATATAGDREMADRIERHRARRGARWRTREVPLALGDCLHREARAERPILVDCLTLWLSNLILADMDDDRERQRLCATLPGLPGPVVFVANEVGLGIVPTTLSADVFAMPRGSSTRLSRRRRIMSFSSRPACR